MIWIWTGVLVGALIIELATPTALISVWFALGALAALLAALFSLLFLVQLIVFALVCVLSLCIIRPLAARALRGNVVATNADRLIGTTAIVEEHISPQKWGSVRVQGRVWSAVSMDGSSVEPGTRVRIKAIEGAKLIVMPIHGPKGEEHV